MHILLWNGEIPYLFQFQTILKYVTHCVVGLMHDNLDSEEHDDEEYTLENFNVYLSTLSLRNRGWA